MLVHADLPNRLSAQASFGRLKNNIRSMPMKYGGLIIVGYLYRLVAQASCKGWRVVDLKAHLSFLKGLLQDVVHIIVDLVQLLLLDVALSNQALCVLLVRVLVRANCLHTEAPWLTHIHRHVTEFCDCTSALLRHSHMYCLWVSFASRNTCTPAVLQYIDSKVANNVM